MKAIQSLATSALLGTSRRPPDWPVLEGPVGTLIAKIPRESAERALLETAGVLGICQAAGWTPPVSHAVGADVLSSAQDHARAEVPEATLQVLWSILTDGPQRLQAEAFHQLHDKGRTLSHRLLPKALDEGKRHSALRPSLLSVMGTRGRWLATQNPDWAYASPGNANEAQDDDLWQHGSLDQRKLFLKKLRLQDSQRARDLLSAALPNEGARERAALLESLSTSLQLEDQDLLEPALTDKSKEVRQITVRLLSSLPQSRYMQRMACRLLPLLKCEKRLLRGTLVTLDPPPSFDLEWKTDQIEEAKPQGSPLGERAWWLLQLIRATPLDWWPAQTGMTPQGLIEWAQKSEWQQAILQGWSWAQNLQQRADWAEAFLDSGVTSVGDLNLISLLSTLPQAPREKQLLRLAFTSEVKHNYPIGHLLTHFLQSMPSSGLHLSPETSKVLLEQLRKRMISGEASQDWGLRAALVELACVVPVEHLDAWASGWDFTVPEVGPFNEPLTKFSLIADQRKHLKNITPFPSSS